MKKKILFLIFSSKKNSGGGHFYSIKSISSGLKNIIEYKILNLGAIYAKPLRDESNSFFLNLFKYNYFIKIFSVIKFVKQYNPDVLHAFDFKSLFIARSISLIFKVRIIFTKCGGPNGSNFIPDADVHILFSKENYKHFQLHSSSKIPQYLIPNRVNKVEIDFKHEKKILNEFNLKNRFILMRISRFNQYYDLTFQQSIELLKIILKKESNAILVFIGKIQSNDYFHRLRQKTEGLPVLFITDDVYTYEASRLLNIADIVISTGRGVMEACSLNKIIFCPVNNSKIPVILNENSFESLSTMNFSERATLDEETILKYNSEFLNSKAHTNTKYFFDNYFSIKAVSSLYEEIYYTKQRNNFRLWNFIGHAIRFFKP